MGPSAIRYAGLDERIVGARPPLRGLGRRRDGRRRRRPRSATSACATCRRSRRRASGSPRWSRGPPKSGYLPLVLGGDHSVALGTLGGMARARGRGGVLWLDAHGDLNRPETSPTGNVHGMPLAAALGLAGPEFESDDVPAAGRRAAAGRARRRPLARPGRAGAAGRARGARLHDERPRPDGRRDRDARGARARRRRRVRAPQPRHGRARPRGRARRRARRCAAGSRTARRTWRWS